MIEITTVFVLLLCVLLVITILKKRWIELTILSALILGVVFLLLLPGLFLKSTDLLGEGFDQMKIGSSIDNEDTIEIENNSYYLALKDNPEIYVRAEDQIIKELTLVAEPTDISISTKHGINLKSTFNEVVQQYGNSYRVLKAVQMYGTGIEYRDKKNGIMIRFFFDNDNPSSIVRNMEIIKKKTRFNNWRYFSFGERYLFFCEVILFDFNDKWHPPILTENK